jgi:hypothetical protein
MNGFDGARLPATFRAGPMSSWGQNVALDHTLIDEILDADAVRCR